MCVVKKELMAGEAFFFNVDGYWIKFKDIKFLICVVKIVFKNWLTEVKVEIKFVKYKLKKY